MGTPHGSEQIQGVERMERGLVRTGSTRCWASWCLANGMTLMLKHAADLVTPPQRRLGRLLA